MEGLSQASAVPRTPSASSQRRVRDRNAVVFIPLLKVRRLRPENFSHLPGVTSRKRAQACVT